MSIPGVLDNLLDPHTMGRSFYMRPANVPREVSASTTIPRRKTVQPFWFNCKKRCQKLRLTKRRQRKRSSAGEGPRG
jgi:hypothetical protein